MILVELDKDFKKIWNRYKGKPESGISLYSKVQTPDGIGVVISMCCLRVNGLSYDPNCSEVVVWYGMDNVTKGWVQRTYDLKDISLI